MTKKIRKSAQGILGDVLRKVPISGASEIRLPGDIRKLLLSNILSNMETLRNGALEVFAVEVSRLLSKLDMQRILDDTLRNYTLKIEAKLELEPKKKNTGAKARAKKK